MPVCAPLRFVIKTNKGFQSGASQCLYIIGNMVNDRRKSPRVRVNLPARWEGAMSQGVATVTDLSQNGCFVLTGGTVEVKELIWIEVELPDGEMVPLWGEVVDAAYDIGFALKFNSGTGEGEARLRRFIEKIFVSDSRKK